MGILSPIMSYIVDKEMGFPAPSETEKINKTIERYRRILSKFPNRSDIGEIKFGLADLLIGRNAAGDYKEANRHFEEILKMGPSQYLKARILVGKAELLGPTGKIKEIETGIALCEEAHKILKNELIDFFAAKTVVVKADLFLMRNKKGDHNKAFKLYDSVVRYRGAHWYFRARALLGKAELILYHKPVELTAAIKMCVEAGKLMESRSGDYFTYKIKIIDAELRIRRAERDDLFRAQKLLSAVIAATPAYQDLIARAKIDLAEISKHPRAAKLCQEVIETEGLDPYLADKARQVCQKLSLKKS